MRLTLVAFFLIWLELICLYSAKGFSANCVSESEVMNREAKPNIIVIFCDDLGWGNACANDFLVAGQDSAGHQAGVRIYARFYGNLYCSCSR